MGLFDKIWETPYLLLTAMLMMLGIRLTLVEFKVHHQEKQIELMRLELGAHKHSTCVICRRQQVDVPLQHRSVST
ncbi:uncharacterized protein N7459_001212 [Penicillium hispanicum]|uniref:uncharacterized protein n=1 Tax=Penicillium hispanicum TaxID=1080232 RepID=UPI00253FB438|nr:uncharacterized protein N7459_001212 [Penicillium hispanicum]KAJ5595004.1 hypothetical protein N7459_001212 [Penicillium hispanicum]